MPQYNPKKEKTLRWGLRLRRWHGNLNLVLALLEQGLAILLALAIAVMAVRALFLRWDDFATYAAKVGTSWVALLIFLTPLYFRTIREFLEQADELFGAKKPKERKRKGRLLRNPPPPQGRDQELP